MGEQIASAQGPTVALDSPTSWSYVCVFSSNDLSVPPVQRAKAFSLYSLIEKYLDFLMFNWYIFII